MKDGNAIEVCNVEKKFKVFLDKGHTLKEMTLFRNRRQYQNREVLKGISFEVKKGEAIGLIGQNGCGKSTTLKLLTRIMYPDSGTIEMKGRVSSLIELGAGFHPDMSGRQNIYTNASIFGLTRHEIDKRIEDIIAFSELREYIDNPVRTYSSGMYMRLAFAVAINVDADILLIDEILAVGDAAFQAKCFNRLREIKAMGTTIVIVSHSMGQIEQICDRAIWIKDGEIEEEGSPRDIIQTYMAWIMSGDKFSKESEDENNDTDHRETQAETKDKEETCEYTLSDILELKKTGKCKEIGNHDVEIVDYELLDALTMKRKNRFSIGDSIVCRIFYKRNNPAVKETMCSFSIYREDGLNCYSTNSFINTGENISLREAGVIEFEIKDNPLMQGIYKMDISLNKDYGPTYHGFINACSFEVYNVTTDYGVCRPNVVWSVDRAEDESLMFNHEISKDHYIAELNIEKILKLDNDISSFECLQNEDYDLVIVSKCMHDLQQKNDAIQKALDSTKYILIENADLYQFSSKIKNCHEFETNGIRDVLMHLSTKNKELVLEIIKDLENDEGEKKWLLNCFRDGEFEFEVVKLQEKDQEEAGIKIKINLINKTLKTAVLLDEGIAFGYKVPSEADREGVRVDIRKNVYPGNNLYEVVLHENPGTSVQISIVKEGEYWLNNILSEEYAKTIVL